MVNNNHTKIFFKYFDSEINEEITEGVWAIKNGDYYKLDNIPFYVYYYAVDDIVEVIEKDKDLIVSKLVEASGNSTIRILFKELRELDRIRDELIILGCDSEVNRISQLLAVNIPKAVNYKIIKEYLDYLEINNYLEYEESCISEYHNSIK